MITRITKTLLIVIASIMYVPNVLAQGIIVYKSDGTTERISYVAIDSIVNYADYKDEVNNGNETQETHEAVDLGLSVKWATCNVGANSPEEYGDYFAWGETEAKSSYDYDSSVTHGLSISELQSRCIIGDDGNLALDYDAASVNWGGNWRMPTYDEINELIDKCTWGWITYREVKGHIVTGPNGNSIFLPAAGSRYDTDLDLAGSSGYYWSATPSSSSNRAYRFNFGSGYYDWYDYNRRNGFSVRPVSE